eukprot:CAMPEP_0172681272 /NCGR_PEP_ID=MMETSP1074-20121228/17333_1 /TAXON_ID=2916 /ORGANISM="Ceratium fusus, Strain PA161109" /LENGTH=578 /DNA_ID=CAMNT_0013499743 /DNA_START=24 /DNA_END=1757 /DNA_ORIENTATION=-
MSPLDATVTGGSAGAKAEYCTVGPDKPASRGDRRSSSPGGRKLNLDDFEFLDGEDGRSLGKGSFGVVRRARLRSTGEVYALKTMQKIEVIEDDLIDQVEREIQVQRNLKHENVLRLYTHFEDAETVYLLLEYCAKGSLYQLLRTCRNRRFTEDIARHYFVQVARGLDYLHVQGIVHRDLKPENLLVNSDDVLKIADLGWCAFAGVTRTTFCGTLDYLAPEMIQGRGHNQTLDIWSLGVLLYEMVVGRPPFQSTNHVLLISNILAAELKFPPTVPLGVTELVKRLLQKDPSARFPLADVLSYGWVTGKDEPTTDGFVRGPSPLHTATKLRLGASTVTSTTSLAKDEQQAPSQPQPTSQLSPRGASIASFGPVSVPSAFVPAIGQQGRVSPSVSFVAQPPAGHSQTSPPVQGTDCRRMIPVAGVSQSVPQTPVQRVPYRGIHAGSDNFPVGLPPSSASRCESPTPSHRVARQPRNSTADMANSNTALKCVGPISKTSSSVMLATSAPPTPLQQHRRLQHKPRVSTAAPGSPLHGASASVRSFSPVGLPATATMPIPTSSGPLPGSAARGLRTGPPGGMQW